jgi:hypothetical protein
VARAISFSPHYGRLGANSYSTVFARYIIADELANALGDDANFAGTMTTALANRVRYDAAQTLTAPQKVQAKSNIDAYGNLEIGNPDSDFVATFNAGLV